MWKKLLYVIIGIIVLLAVAIFVATRMIDADRVKQVLVQQVEQQTGQELVFEGDLSWRLFPSLGFDVGEVSLLNRGDFGSEPMLSLAHAGISVELMPLFSRQVNIGQVQLQGLQANLVTLGDGRSNLSQLLDRLGESGQPPAEPAPAGEPADSGTALEGLTLQIAGVVVEDARVLLEDRGTGVVTDISDINLSAEAFDTDTWVPLQFSASIRQPEMMAALEGNTRLQVSSAFDMVRLEALESRLTATGDAIPGQRKQLVLTSDGSFDVNQQVVQLTRTTLNLDNDIYLRGQLGATLATVPAVRFSLQSDSIDLDAYLEKNVPTSEPSTTGEQPDTEEGAPAQEPDLRFLNSVDITGDLTLGELKVANLDVADIRLEITSKGGILTLTQFAAQLYDGTVNATATLDGRKVPATFRVAEQLTGVQVRPLLTDLAEVDLLSGSGNISTDLTGTGLTDSALRRNLGGTIEIQFADGALYGINLPAKLRQAKAALGGQLDATAEEEKTDFSELSATFNIGQGVAKTTNIKMLSPFVRVNGQGQTDLVKETLDFSLSTVLVPSTKGQGGKEAEDLGGVQVPLKITGGWAEPKFKLAVEEVLKQRLEQEKAQLKQKAEEKLQQKGQEVREKLQEKLPGKLDLNKLFGD